MVAKIGWLQSNIGIVGGSELSCSALVSNAPAWAEVVLCPPYRRPPQDIDLFVIQNSTTYDTRWIEELMLKPVVRQVRDPWYAGSSLLRRWTLENAALLVFSSPIHLESFAYEFDVPYHIIPPPVNLEPFRGASQPEDERRGTVFVGRVDIYKGAPACIDWALRTGEELALIGKPLMGFGQLPPFIRLKGEVPYAQMPTILGSAARYIAMPEWPEAFGRSVVEAWAAGCELLLKGRIGAQWWIENEPETLGFEKPVALFWSAIKSVL